MEPQSNNNSLELTESEKYRYDRQIKLSEVGISGQLKLKNSKVIVIGAGGLGSSCLMNLGGCGIGKICIVDYDNVDIQNLHRQIIHNTSSAGLKKAISAKKFINALNPEIEVISITDKFNNENAIELCKNYDIIVDCCDNAKTRYICNDAAVLLNKPFISAGTVRWDGQVGVYVKSPSGGVLPCYRCLHPIPPPEKNVKKCSEVGIMGTLPSIMGSLEANEVIKFILGRDDNLLIKKIMIYDGLDNKVKIMKTRDIRDDCVICGKNKSININNFKDYDYDTFIKSGNS